jgi:tetratricopeptide (TPR) repeat protein
MSLAPSGFTDEPNKPQVPLFDGLGERSRKIQTKNPKAQRYFDQGVMFIADFNHDEAVRSFREAARLDPECAMAYWGIALARSTNINHPDFTPAKAKVIAEAVAKAREKANGEKDANRALIEALAVRYPAPAPKERADAEKAYSRAMKAVWEKFPKDADVGTLYAESLMNLRPYDYWKEDGKPQPWTPEILGTLDTVRILDPTHPLANHLYIHAVDWSPESGKAIAAADALRGKYPALGHLVHMPSHIDVIHGRWQQAIDANRLALAADCKYRKAVPEQGIYRMYMAHNFHMLTFAATMQGQSDLALKTMREMIVELFPKEVVAVKENVVLADGLMAMPLEVLKRFGRWDDVLKEPEPPEIFPFTRAMRHYNRGVAFAAKAQVDKAREAQRSFRAAVKLVPEGAQFTLHFNKAADLLAIADHMLEGEILFREGKRKEAIAALETAVAREDRLLPDDPPDWFIPARHTLGATLLKSKQAEAAQKVYREDLRRWPNNGWSLHGLAQTLQALNKKEEAAKVKERFKEAWKRADLEIPSSCFCVEGR